MIFKRRDKRSWLSTAREFLWPRGGWARAFHYVKHRLRRLPDEPETIARGIWAGIFTAFTPFYGLHFLIAAGLAKAMRGNILAALLGTFFGNPLTYIPIGAASLGTGHFLLGTGTVIDVERSLGGKFADAFLDLAHNFTALFSDRVADWHGLHVFFAEVFYPYLVGGIFPGVICAYACYFLSVPVIRAYKNRRKGMLKKKLAEIREKAAQKAAAKKVEGQPHDP